MGPIAKLWKILEGAKQAEDEAVQTSVNELLFFFEQIVLLLGKSSNAITYHRRLNVLGCIMNSQYQVKTMLKEKAALYRNMSVNCFERNLGITLLIQYNQREKQGKSSQILKILFCGAPHIHRDGVRGKMFFSSRAEDRITENSIMVEASFVNRHKQVNKDMDMVNIHSSSRTFFNMNSVPEIGLKWELENVHPLIKRLLSSDKVPNVPIAGRLKHFSKTWKKLTTDQSILDLLDSSVIVFQRKPFQSKIPFQLTTSREQQKLINTDVKEMFNKGAIRQYSTVKRVLKEFVPCKREG